MIDAPARLISRGHEPLRTMTASARERDWDLAPGAVSISGILIRRLCEAIDLTLTREAV
jgi:hypothetical protein